jgi:hypothetical protein
MLSNLGVPDDATNMTLTLGVWNIYATSPDGGVDSSTVLSIRHVWVLKQQYDELMHIRFGLMQNVEVTSSFDAETGESLGLSTSGTLPEDYVSRDSLVGHLVVPF